MLKSRELGQLVVDSGDVVCLSMDSVLEIIEKLGVSEEDFFDEYDGVRCDFRSDGVYGVDHIIAVNKDGSTYPVALIGADVDNLDRFLTADEQTFSEHLESHPLKTQVGTGDKFDNNIFQEIVNSYKRKLFTAGV